jgi:hypothetical protein
MKKKEFLAVLSVLFVMLMGRHSSVGQNVFPVLKNLPLEHILFDSLQINNCMVWFSNTGYDSFDPRTENGGFYWPNPPQMGQTLVFLEGLQWGGKINDSIYVGGTFYTNFTVPLILEETDTGKVYSRIWKIRKDWETFPEGEYKTRLEKDYAEWPVELGAPWEDVNGDGIFTRGIDKPKFFGDEQLYMIYHPADSSHYAKIFRNIEIHELVYAFDSTNFLSNVIFKRYEIINKTGDTLKDFYATYWADNDLGNAENDYIGCDSSLFMGFSFNSDTADAFYSPVAPSIGHIVLKGLNQDGKNLMMTAFGPNFKGAGFSHDPADSVQFYNLIRGFMNDGGRFIDPFTGMDTKFPLSGDPFRHSGWYEGENWPPIELYYNTTPPPGDRRYYLVSGPVDFLPNDTQTVVIAAAVGLGNDNLESVEELKKTALKLHKFFGNDIKVGTPSNITSETFSFSLAQNYPNPFNPITTISYSIPSSNVIATPLSRRKQSSNVTLSIYNLLGQRIATLINKAQVPGNYSVQFDASNLPSGVYFYRLRAGNFVATKKMVLLK